MTTIYDTTWRQLEEIYGSNLMELIYQKGEIYHICRQELEINIIQSIFFKMYLQHIRRGENVSLTNLHIWKQPQWTNDVKSKREDGYW